MQINKKTLANGLTLIHVERPATRMVTVNTLFRVGSRNEDPAHTGFAHLFEHLMFGGTEAVPDFDTPLQEAGGENNAFTCEDFTNYYDQLPACHIETALWLESDRMRGLDLGGHSLEVQRKVVMEEFKLTSLNQPYGDIPHLLAAMAWPEPSGYNWPVIGRDLDHIRRATRPQVRRFFSQHYRPSNAILSIVGGITWEDTQRLVDKYYADIPDTPTARPTATPPAAPPVRQHQLRVCRPVPDSVLMLAYRIPPRTHPDFAACDLLSDILGNGPSSRLYRGLVEERPLFLTVDASVDGRLGEGILVVEGDVRPDVERWQACHSIEACLRELKQQEVPAAELEKLQNKFETHFALMLADSRQLAEMLAYYEMLGDARLIEREVDAYRSVTPAQLQRVARHVFTQRNCCHLYYQAVPDKQPQEAKNTKNTAK